MRRVTLLTLLTLLTVGCEGDRESTVVNEAVAVPTNGPSTVAQVDVNGNQNETVVYLENAPGVTQVVAVDVQGNSNFVGVIGVVKEPEVDAVAGTEP